VHGITVDAKDRVWISGNGERDTQILAFSRTGKFLLQIGRAGKSGGSNDTSNVARATQMRLDHQRNEVFVSDGEMNQNHRVIVFDSETGAYKRHWGAYGGKPDDAAAAAGADPAGAPPRQFGNAVHCLRIDRDGLVYVCDRSHNRFQIFGKDGRFEKEMFLARETASGGTVADLDFSPDQKFIYVADGANQKVWIVLRNELRVVGSFGERGPGAGQFQTTLHDLTVDSKGNVYTGEAANGGRVQKFAVGGVQSAHTWEEIFRAIPAAAAIGQYMERLSARPHHIGAPYTKESAEWMLARFREWGWNAEIESYEVLFPTPRERVLEMVAPRRFKAALEEPAIAVDPTSNQKSEQLPTYNAYSIDGDVTGPLVYVNYGRPEDYDELEALGVSVRGAIVIARYGGSFRGTKPKIAAEHGAIGCLIYSDPRDDGYFGDAVFPDGPMRNANGVQRGSVIDLPQHAGDPLTPGVAATRGAKRLAVSDAPTLTRIPVLPISYGDAQPLLAAMAGPIAPPLWRGALPITYRLGPGPSEVHLKVSFNWDIKPIYNVIARLEGSTFADEWIVRGNHHDAWVNGAADPVSGLAPALEEARALGQLAKQGWRPKRTIVYAAWDGEEAGLIGSTEWVEQHQAELRQKAVVYINSDGNGRGFLQAGGSHTLEHFVNDVARSIEDPETKGTVWQRWQAQQISQGSADKRSESRTRGDLRINALGSGSDYTPFLQHHGTASLNLSFGGFDDDGIYHSIYDDFYHFKKFSDPGFLYGRALAQFVGTAVLRLADADVLPYEFTGLAETVQSYVRELQSLLKQRQDDVRERNRQISEGVLAAINDPRRPRPIPKVEPVPPALNFAPLENASTALATAASRWHKALETRRVRIANDPNALKMLNARLIQSERQFVDELGLPRRPWYRHLLYAPGYYTGYGVKTMPGVREAIEEKRFADVEREVVRLAAALDRETALIEGLMAELERLTR
jgi:N-acetylated-alpha-linked acidic dipeptidase